MNISKKWKGIICVTILLGQYNLSARENEVIYGEDDRVETGSSKSEDYKTWAKSTAAYIPNFRLKKLKNGGWQLRKERIKTLKDAMSLCPGQRFEKRPAASYCSGFLVGPNILITAGHCVTGGRMGESCRSFKWVFNYKIKKGEDPFSMKFSKDEVYRCKEVYEAKFDRQMKEDWAIVVLDRPVKGRKPLKRRRSQKKMVKANTPLAIIGHPWGIPSIVADSAKVLPVNTEKKNYFSANLDSFQGNSGAAVFNAKSGMVEGFLVRGKIDATYAYHPQHGYCGTINRCDDSGEKCQAIDRLQGEEVHRIAAIDKKIQAAIKKYRPLQ